MLANEIVGHLTDLGNELLVITGHKQRSELNYDKREEGIVRIADELDKIGYPYTGHLNLHRYIKLPSENGHTPKLTAFFSLTQEVTPGDLDRREGGKYVPYIFSIVSPTPVPENLGNHFKVRQVNETGSNTYGISGNVYYWNTELGKITLGSDFTNDVRKFDEEFRTMDNILKESGVYSDLVSVF